jgi:hypothetical protein
MAKKNSSNTTGFFLTCQCGAKAAVFHDGDCKWHAHCPGCGFIGFWTNPQLTARVEAGGKLCPHKPPVKICKNGTKTSWCTTCRVRTFLPS